MAESADDLNLPNAVIGRIIKEALPPNTNVSKESRLAISKAASVFVLYCTSCANQFALDQKRKTLKDIDIFNALEEMELDSFVPELKSALEKFKVAKNEKKKAKEAANQSETVHVEAMDESIKNGEVEVVNGDH